jgi:hypothetical protein
MSETTGIHVYQAIAAVCGYMAKTGLAKDRKNEQQHYNFRGIDDVYNVLSSALAEQKLVILPRVMERQLTERQTAKGGVLFYVVLKVEFDFVSSVDGSKHTVITYGEAMDSGDKATNKAMSAAYKYAALQAFCIPTIGDNDADATTHEVVPINHKPEPSKLDKFKAAAIKSLNKYPADIIAMAFEEMEGLQTDKEGADMISELVHQIDSCEKLTNIGTHIRKIWEALPENQPKVMGDGLL